MPGRLVIRAIAQLIRSQDSTRVLICPVSIITLLTNARNTANPREATRPSPEGTRWHLSVSPTLLRSYPTGQVRRKEKGRLYISHCHLKIDSPLRITDAVILPDYNRIYKTWRIVNDNRDRNLQCLTRQRRRTRTGHLERNRGHTSTPRMHFSTGRTLY